MRETGLSIVRQGRGSGKDNGRFSRRKGDLPPERDYAGHHAAAEEALGRCHALYFRILGRLSLAAGRVEGVLGLGPMLVED